MWNELGKVLIFASTLESSVRLNGYIFSNAWIKFYLTYIYNFNSKISEWLVKIAGNIAYLNNKNYVTARLYAKTNNKIIFFDFILLFICNIGKKPQ